MFRKTIQEQHGMHISLRLFDGGFVLNNSSKRSLVISQRTQFAENFKIWNE